MQLLKDKILCEGQAIGTDIIKIDSFLNHQIDVGLISRIGEEFSRRFANIPVTKILTIEASGIAIACATAMHMGNVPVVFAKKAAPSTMIEGYYATEVTSYTKRAVSTVMVSKNFLLKGDKILIIDDFMAHGEAAWGLADLVKQSGATVMGIGIAVEKSFQGGSSKLREAGYTVESLAVIASIEDGHIVFK